MVEFDSWIVCPKCHNAMVGVEGEECFLCGVECVATPLYPELRMDTEAEKITAGIQRARKLQATGEEDILTELGLSPEDAEVAMELGL